MLRFTQADGIIPHGLPHPTRNIFRPPTSPLLGRGCRHAANRGGALKLRTHKARRYQAARAFSPHQRHSDQDNPAFGARLPTKTRHFVPRGGERSLSLAVAFSISAFQISAFQHFPQGVTEPTLALRSHTLSRPCHLSAPRTPTPKGVNLWTH